MTTTQDAAEPNRPLVAMDAQKAQELILASTNKPHEGRVYDFYMGGTANYAIDREFAKQQIARVPTIPWACVQNRQFLLRMVRYMTKQGIRQFIDIGAGLPTQGATHEICEQQAPGECTVVYVDHDPVAIAHSVLLLEHNDMLGRHVPILGDIRDYNQLWDGVLESGRIDPTQPIGLLVNALLHFMPDKREPYAVIEWFRDVLPSGSYLGLSHVSYDGMSEEARAAFAAVLADYDKATSPACARSRNELMPFFGDFDLVEPGLDWVASWDPAHEQPNLAGADPTQSLFLGGLARKP
ncbi:SAM-dependent methyltransferase [Kibdelosporangium lantanae]|uniref:SAM-dependent methyltransferase n=1 Tax=Kibdelosporangium lantanae TaxID=1497396 RepID=A0ABW3M159_9PSEU